jgi:hypothetical protein
MSVTKAQQFNWSEHDLKLLKREWAKGTPAARIAVMVGAPTRNVVIGKVHRLGLSARPSPIRSGGPGGGGTSGSGARARRPRVARKDGGWGNQPFAWNDDRDAILKAGYSAGAARSVADIAGEIGCSEHTVLRRAADLGLKHPRRYERKLGFCGGAGDSDAARELRQRLMATAPAVAPESLNLPLGEVKAGCCRFPTSPHSAGRGQHRFCGAPIGPLAQAEGGASLNYCAYHQLRAVRRDYTHVVPVKEAA